MGVNLQQRLKWFGVAWGAVLLASSPISLKPAISMEFHQVSTTQTQGLGSQPIPLIEVSPVWGLTISFIPSGELIQQVRVGDPSRILVDFDSPLGESSGGSGDETTGATVIYLRQLGQPLNLSLRLTPQAVSTSDMPMSVVTLDRARNRHLHQFRLRLGQPTSYSTVEVVPELVLAQRRLAAAQVQPPRPRLSLLTPPARSSTVAQTLERGLAIAQTIQLAALNPEMWERCQQLLILLRDNQPLETAAAQTGVPIDLANQVLDLARNP